MKQVRIGTRESALAMKQAEIVAREIKAYAPDIETILVPIKTTGDLLINRPLESIGGKGVFVKELDQALLNGIVDICVHSLKDLPTQRPNGICLLAVGKREDPRDAMVFPKGMQKALPDKPIGCSSLRRKVQLQMLYPNCWVEPIRGNVLTRLEKLDRGDYGALVLAAAGLKRLGLTSRAYKFFSYDQLIPACGQGIIGVTALSGTQHPYLAGFHDLDTWDIAQCEMAFLHTLGGGCTSPVAAHARIIGDRIHLLGYVLDKNGQKISHTFSGMQSQAVSLGVGLAAYLQEEADANA